ncbi:helix-turn-helix domain-containing protein [Leifsonia sp. H3M29-4]|uniref:helix-turn-helix domain-containing protein n=1 Tax=Salinibacterium metalliresistens TaxID=3031321 RepID=UPI0023DC43A7|nr:helix-turn-helix domain-containing protein [Salinibacterium metalliresistens]MDF1478790.1 helix-turn-helix domain-containing protein [Salinibacterium metalliresistens]
MDGTGATGIDGRSMIRLNDKQQAVLAWVVQGCPPGVYPDDDFSHRVTARALKNRGLIELSGHGRNWRAHPTARGQVWPQATVEDEHERQRLEQPHRRLITEQGDVDAQSGALGRALRRMPRKDPARPKKKLPVKQVNRQETYMRYKVVVTRVQVAEKWVRATDEEDAARKVQEEFAKPYSYFGNWETKASEVEIIEAEQTTVIHPNTLSESGPMLLSLKDAAAALGIPYSALYELTNRGEIEYTKMGSRKYIQRESLMNFIAANTHRGYYPG